ncbi:MAG: tetratricopeptide repeat protein [Candidatus Omnitrophota bacterium]|nr:tetratricopeptide repeat protein [Candidatus Omnitrophota bacterium]
MLDFRKVLKFKFLFLLLFIWVFSAKQVYCSESCGYSTLRIPLLFESQRESNREQKRLASNEGVLRRDALQKIAALTASLFVNPVGSFAGQNMAATDRAKVNLQELLSAKLAYPQKSRNPKNPQPALALSSLLKTAFSDIDFYRIKKPLKDIDGTMPEDLKDMAKLMQSARDLGFTNYGNPKEVMRLLVSSLFDIDIFYLIEKSDLPQDVKRKMAENLISCIDVTQFFLIKFIYDGFDDVKRANAPEHSVLVRPVKGYEDGFSLIDPSQRIIGSINYPAEYYVRPQGSNCWVLREDCRIEVPAKSRLKKMDDADRGIVNLNALTEEERKAVLYKYYFYLDISAEFNYGFTPNLLNNIGDVLIKLKMYAEAQGVIKKAIEYNPNYFEAYNNLGVAIVKSGGQLNDAELQYRTAVKLNPSYSIARYNLGNVLFRKAMLREAAAEYEIVVSIDPKDALAYFNLAYSYFGLGDIDKAGKNWEKAISLNPSLLNDLSKVPLPEDLKKRLRLISENNRRVNQPASFDLAVFASLPSFDFRSSGPVQPNFITPPLLFSSNLSGRSSI